MDDFDWDAWDAQTAEYLNSSPTYQDYDWAPEYQDWLSSYEQPDLGVFMDPSAWEGYNTESTGQESTYVAPDVSSEDALNQWLSEQYPSGGNNLSALLMPEYGQSIGAEYQRPQATSLLGEDFRPAQSYVLSDGTVVGMPSSGADVQNPYDYVMGPNGEVLIVDTQTRQTVGRLDENGDQQSFQDDLRKNAAKLGVSLSGLAGGVKGGKSDSSDEDYQKILKNLLAKQAIDQMKAKQAYANSGVGKALSGLGMAGMLYQALKGKNNAPKVEARGNQGVSFSPAYQGSSAPKTKYASGGEVLGGLPRMALEQALRKAGRVQGQGGGQDDVVDIKAAPGEYVFDAEAVSALGDGNTEEGARKLDEMRMNIRKHKRTGGLSSIPPKAKKPEQYMKKGK